MSPPNESLPPELQQLCAQASCEKDPATLLQLIERINRLLADKADGAAAPAVEKKVLK